MQRACRFAGLAAVVGLPLIAWTLVAGCRQLAPLEAPPVIHSFQPSDLPVPYNFELDESKSWAFTKYLEGPLGFRSLELVYWGHRSPNEVANWYLDQMPLHGWSHVRTDNEQGIHLIFHKESEESEIILMRAVDRNGEFHITQLKARIGVK